MAEVQVYYMPLAIFQKNGQGCCQPDVLPPNPETDPIRHRAMRQIKNQLHTRVAARNQFAV